jgi:hypothetical protein
MQEALVSRRGSGLDGRGLGAGARGDNRDAREREARKACFTGDVAHGVEILVDLYGETGTRTTSTTRRAASNATASTIRRCSATRTICARRRTSPKPTARRSKNR